MSYVAREYKRLIFLVFMYAVVVGSAFEHLDASIISFKFLFIIFMIVIILEDLYLFHIEISPYEDRTKPISLISLCFEIGILIAWHTSVVSISGKVFSISVCSSALQPSCV